MRLPASLNQFRDGRNSAIPLIHCISNSAELTQGVGNTSARLLGVCPTRARRGFERQFMLRQAQHERELRAPASSVRTMNHMLRRAQHERELRAPASSARTMNHMLRRALHQRELRASSSSVPTRSTHCDGLCTNRICVLQPAQYEQSACGSRTPSEWRELSGLPSILKSPSTPPSGRPLQD